MFVLKAFATNNNYTNNTPGQVSNIGELSTQSLTYSKEVGEYRSQIHTDLELITFTLALNGSKIELPEDVKDIILNISDFVYSHVTNNGVTLFTDILLNDLINTYIATASNFKCGAVVTDGSKNIIEWLSWTNVSNNADLNGGEIRIWFSDGSFQLQYDDYEIVVVPPLEHIDTFFSPVSNIVAQLKLVSIPTLMENIKIAKDSHPETSITSIDFDFVDTSGAHANIPTTWTVIGYGGASASVDNIKNALIDYILSHSTETQQRWTAIFPTIFKKTEFVIVPNWNRYSIPNMTLQAGIYSPALTMSKALQLVKSTVTNYPEAHIISNADVLSQPYKSLTLVSVGNPDNYNNKYSISEMFPDYIDIPSTSIDFSRMSQTTQDWAILLVRLLMAAETATSYSALPNNITKVTRSGILYLVGKFQNIDYLVAAKSNF